ncbi:hypothetical protein BIFGAL_04416 [Bifidobacterium gallicum DSM 20093 = LMG 11596]|uniref:Uncharacterized protein n=1 Tax=Bifidobacterium gallicum DSM 20093 = LMG 11596 TaxID=561180 RepID=D1NX08_9BIFI|nr:hypothetical protein BIFGAL_04416 [Bifidobacterium gallicum DSM 20093 = LMG 11596]
MEQKKFLSWTSFRDSPLCTTSQQIANVIIIKAVLSAPSHPREPRFP